MSTEHNEQDTMPSVEEIEALLAAKRKDLEHAERQREQAEAAMDADVMVEATQRASVLRGFITRLEQQLRDAHEAQGRDEAATRLLGIKRAHGSLAASLNDDEQRVRAAVATLTDAIARMNARYAALAKLRQEAAALTDRFTLPAPELPHIVPPALRGIIVTPQVMLADYARPKPLTERCEYGLRERRTYQEVRGTEAYDIITKAGLKAFRLLTEREQQSIERRARERAENARRLAPTLATAAELERALDSVPGASGLNAF